MPLIFILISIFWRQLTIDQLCCSPQNEFSRVHFRGIARTEYHTNVCCSLSHCHIKMKTRQGKCFFFQDPEDLIQSVYWCRSRMWASLSQGSEKLLQADPSSPDGEYNTFSVPKTVPVKALDWCTVWWFFLTRDTAWNLWLSEKVLLHQMRLLAGGDACMHIMHNHLGPGQETWHNSA